MEYRYLEAFLQVSKLESVTRAARALQVAPSAVSRQIRLLEQGMKQSLFLRLRNRMVLTPEGRSLYIACDHLDRSLQKKEVRPLKLGALPGLFEGWVIPRLSSEQSWSLNCVLGSSSELFQLMVNGDLDLALVNERPAVGGLKFSKVGEERMVYVRLKGVSEENWIFGGEGKDIRAFFGESVKPRRKIVCYSPHLILKMVEEGLGVAILPEYLVHSERPNTDLLIKPTSVKSKKAIYLVGPELDFSSPDVRSVRELLSK